MTITLTREEAQQVLDALDKVFDHNDWQSYETAVYLLRARLAQETPYEVGQRLYRQGLGISDIPTAVYSDSDIAEAYRGFEDARLAQLKQEPVMLMDAPLLLNGQPLYPAPAQRERVQFPTMLRKMWSGTEVQAWLDENVNQENNND